MKLCYVMFKWIFVKQDDLPIFPFERKKTMIRTCAPSEDSDQPMHSYSLIGISIASRKHAYIILPPPTPLKSHVYIVKLGFTWVYIIFLIVLQIQIVYSLEPPRRGGSNEYPQSMF